MSQISMPIRIVVAVAAVFLVAWMTILKPKSTEAVPAPTPVTTGNVATGKPAVSLPGKLAEKAKAAATSESGHASAAAGETTGSATESAPATAAKTTPAGKPTAQDETLAGVPGRVAKAIRHEKVVVIGFFGAKAADDNAVRKALSKVDRWDGRVVVAAASLDHVAKWGRIARGVDVEQSPTVVVVGADLKATPLVGYVDTRSIDQAVVDTLRNTTGLFTNATMRGVNKACASAANGLYATPTAANLPQARQSAKRVSATLAGFVGDLRSVKAPARLKAFKRATVADAVVLRDGWAGFERKLQGHPSAATAMAALSTFVATVTPVEKRFNKRAAKQHLLSCQEV